VLEAYSRVDALGSKALAGFTAIHIASL